MTTANKNILDTILDATLKILAKNKISGTRMHLIAAEAGTSQSNLHYHYPTKNDLLLAAMQRMQEYFDKKRTASVDFTLTRQTPEENLTGLLREKQDDILHHPEIDCIQFDYWVQGTIDPVIQEKLRSSMSKWRADIQNVLLSCKEGADKETITTLSCLMVSMMMGASMQYLLDEQAFSLDTYFTMVKQMVLTALHAAPCGMQGTDEGTD